MAPKRSKKYSSVTALPGGSELEALAWGYHTAKGVRGDRIAAVVNNATEELLSGTGQAQWGVHIPDLGVQLPASKQSVLDSVGEAQLAQAFASSGRRKSSYDPLNTYQQDQALKALTGASLSSSAFGLGSSTFPDGSVLVKAKVFKPKEESTPAQTSKAKAKRASRAAAWDGPLAIEDGGDATRRLFRPDLRRPEGVEKQKMTLTPQKGRVAFPETTRVAIPEVVSAAPLTVSDEDVRRILALDELFE